MRMSSRRRAWWAVACTSSPNRSGARAGLSSRARTNVCVWRNSRWANRVAAAPPSRAVASISAAITTCFASENLPPIRSNHEPSDHGPRPLMTSPVIPELELSHVDRIVSEIGAGPESVIPILQAIQGSTTTCREPALKRVCRIDSRSRRQTLRGGDVLSRTSAASRWAHTIHVCQGTRVPREGRRVGSGRDRAASETPDRRRYRIRGASSP